MHPAPRGHAWAPRVPPAPARLIKLPQCGVLRLCTVACGSPGGGRARGAGVLKAAAIATATSSRMRPRTAASDMAVGVAPVAVAGGGVVAREVSG